MTKGADFYCGEAENAEQAVFHQGEPRVRRRDYSQERPHRALSGRTPHEFAFLERRP